MNLEWSYLTPRQRAALEALEHTGLCRLPGEVGEQLYNLGLAEIVDAGVYCLSATGTTVLPVTVH